MRSTEILTAAVGLEDVIVVTTPDAVLVLNAKEADKVKALVDDLKRRNRREVIEHRRVYRPWGYYQSIDHGPRYQVKRILVRPGGCLSLQKHFHRAEHWIVVKGTAEVSRDDDVVQVHENELIVSADRLRAPTVEPRKNRSRADRGADRQLSWRGRYRPPRGHLQSCLTWDSGRQAHWLCGSRSSRRPLTDATCSWRR